jgi:hypothetical protein
LFEKARGHHLRDTAAPDPGRRTAIASLVPGAEVAVSVVRVVEIRGAAPRGCVGLDRGARYVSSSFAAV